MTSHIINYDINTNLPNLKVQNNLPFVHIFSIHLNTIDPEGLKQELAYLKHRKGERKTKPCDTAELRQWASASGHRSENSSASQCTSCFTSSKLLNLSLSALICKTRSGGQLHMGNSEATGHRTMQVEEHGLAQQVLTGHRHSSAMTLLRSFPGALGACLFQMTLILSLYSILTNCLKYNFPSFFLYVIIFHFLRF